MMDAYTMTQMMTAGLVLGLIIGVGVGWSLCDYFLRKLFIQLAEMRLTPAQREQFGDLMLKVMGK
jgi:hypothetical protein